MLMNANKSIQEHRSTVATYPHPLEELLVFAETKGIVSPFTLDGILAHTIRPSPNAVVNAFPYLLDLSSERISDEEEGARL